MAFTYTTLKTAIVNWTENDSTEFSDELDTIIMLAEDQLLRDLDLDNFRKFATAPLVVGDRFLSKPTDFLKDRWLEIKNASGLRSKLRQKDNSFISEYWPDETVLGVPKYYADWDDLTFVLSPTPSAALTMTLTYTYRPAGLSSSNANTWMSDNAPWLLLVSSLSKAHLFMKMEIQTKQRWDDEYVKALLGVGTEQMVDQRRSEARDGERR